MAKNSDRDKRMAKYLKDNNVTRDTHRCAVCYRIVGNGTKHLISCKGSK